MSNTQFKEEGDDEAVTKQENYFPFPETEISLRQQKWKCTNSAPYSTTNFHTKSEKRNSFL